MIAQIIGAATTSFTVSKALATAVIARRAPVHGRLRSASGGREMRNDGIRPSVEIVVLERLPSLEQEGILTNDELAAAKAKLVGTG